MPTCETDGPAFVELYNPHSQPLVVTIELYGFQERLLLQPSEHVVMMFLEPVKVTAPDPAKCKTEKVRLT